MKKSKILMLSLVIVLIVGLFTGCIPTIPTNSTDLEGERGLNDYDDYKINNVPYFSQGLEHWCLSASAAMVLSYYGRDISVEWIADNIDTGPDGASSTDMISYIENVLGYKVENKGIDKGLSLEEIIKLLKKDTPIIALQALSLTNPGHHARVIIGYDNNFKWLIAHDPYYGEEHRIPYSDFEALNRGSWPFWKKSNLCKSIVIQTGGLQVEADVDPKNGTVPHEVHCVGFASGGPIPYTYQWEFGDGNWSEKVIGIEYRNLLYTYTEPGKYKPVLHVKDSNGEKAKCQVKDVIVVFTLSGPVHNLTKNTYYDTIQTALDDADSGDTIEVSPGTYSENINFLGKNITLRSTKPNNPSKVASTIIDGGGNGSVVTFTSGETAQAELSGFTIQNGNSGTGAGGGIMIMGSSPVISNNVVKGNIAHSDHGGGGIFIAHSASPLIENNTIDGNQGGFGGGIYVGDNSSPTIRNNTIKNNLAEIHRGGGIFISGISSPTIQDNSLSGNSSQYGGGICIVENSSGEISNNYFTLNIAQYGGGIFCGEDSDPIIEQNEFYGNSATSFGGGLFIGECVVNNNVISGNTAQTGGGIFVWESSPIISDNTINGNTTTMSGGGIYVRSNSHPTINSNIISLNTTTMDGGGLYIDGSSSVKNTNGSTWTRQNTPPNAEVTNTYLDNTHGNPLDYTEGADVYMVGAITPPQIIISLSGDLNFGSVQLGSTPTKILKISNTGNSSLLVTGITYPSGFSGSWNGTITAGSYHNVTVTFAPTQVKIYDGTLTVSSNKTSGTSTKLIYGTGTSTKTLTSLTVSPDTMNFTAIGQQQDIQEIILGWSDNTTSSLAEGNATYYSYNTSVADVTGTNMIKVESKGEGDTQIKVSYTDSNNVTKSDYIDVSVEIAPAELQYIEAYPKNMAFDLNDANKCDDVTQVVAWYSDGSWENIDINSVSYLSNNTGVATVNSSGTVCGVGEGNTTIEVTYQGEYDTISVSVTDTGISPPSVTTLDPIYDGGYYIAMKGKIQSTGGENAYEIGFEYQDLAGGSVETINAYGNYEDGRAWNMTLVKGSDITYGHSYKYRAYAVNSAGTGYGTWDTFTVN